MHPEGKFITQRDIQLKLDLSPQGQLLLSFVHPSKNCVHM